MWTWKYIYEINQVKANFYVLNLYVVYHTSKENFEATKGVIRSHQSNKTDNTMTKRKRSKDKQWSTKHFTEN